MSQDLPLNLRSSNAMRQVLGVSEKHFNLILGHFRSLHNDLVFDHFYNNPNRRRYSGGGRKGKLATVSDKLAFCLYYLKNYPTFAVFAYNFNMAKSTAHENLQLYLPLLRATLIELGVEPIREFENDEQLAQYLKKTELERLLLMLPSDDTTDQRIMLNKRHYTVERKKRIL